MMNTAVNAALNAAVEAIMREASERAILPRYQSLVAEDIVSKAVDDVVTVADREAEAMLTERLAALLPEAAVVGEEAVFADASVMERLGHGPCWIVDPLDGTNNFAAGKPPFGVIVALADRGDILGGWILDCLTAASATPARAPGPGSTASASPPAPPARTRPLRRSRRSSSTRARAKRCSPTSPRITAWSTSRAAPPSSTRASSPA